MSLALEPVNLQSTHVVWTIFGLMIRLLLKPQRG